MLARIMASWEGVDLFVNPYKDFKEVGLSLCLSVCLEVSEQRLQGGTQTALGHISLSLSVCSQITHTHTLSPPLLKHPPPPGLQLTR